MIIFYDKDRDYLELFSTKDENFAEEINKTLKKWFRKIEWPRHKIKPCSRQTEPLLQVKQKKRVCERNMERKNSCLVDRGVTGVKDVVAVDPDGAGADGMGNLQRVACTHGGKN